MPADNDTLAPLLHRQASVRGRHPLLICDHERLGYAEAQARSARLARGLIAVGAGKGTHIGVLYPNGADFVIAAFAAARIGAVVVPFSTFATTSELTRQLVDSDIRILLSIDGHRGHDYAARLAEVLPEAFEGTAPRVRDRLLCPAVPQLRHLAISHRSGAGPHAIGELEVLAATRGAGPRPGLGRAVPPPPTRAGNKPTATTRPTPLYLALWPRTCGVPLYRPPRRGLAGQLPDPALRRPRPRREAATPVHAVVPDLRGLGRLRR
ncbi:AMP-binding protein, partial [Nocardia carnea]|uniref:AMP-binding protein n=1 Tax=Nocardia carnea TaxID=37328 RepID=UPI00245438C7